MIRSVRVRGFRRYRDVSFELRPGINFIDGPNNAGKTTLLYAIEYALFGRVGGFTSQSALLHPGERGMGVELCFTGRDGLHYRLQRVHVRPPRARTQIVGHFTLKRQVGEGEPEQYVLSSDFGDTQEALALALQKILGLTARLFDVAVHLRQGRIASILAGAPELDKVLGVTAAVVAAEEMRVLALDYEKQAATLPVLLESRARAVDESAAAARAVTSGEQEQAQQAARSAALHAELRTTAAREAALGPAREQLDVVLAGVDRWVRGEETLARHEASFAQVEASLGVATTHASAAAVELVAAEAQRREAIAAEQAVATRQRVLDRQLGDLEARIERRAGLAGGVHCETCGQPTDAAHVAEQLATWEAERQALEDEQRALQEQRQRAGDDGTHEAAKAAALEAELSLRALQSQKHAAEAALRDAARAVGADAEHARDAARALAGVLENTALPARLGAVAFADDTTHAELEATAKRVSTALSDARDAALVERARLQTELTGLAARSIEIDQRLVEARAHATELARGQASIESEVARVSRAASLAEDVRVLAAGFKELQVSLRDRAAETLAADTLTLHRALAGDVEEFSAVRVDPAKYALHVTPHDVGEDVPAHLFQGGGHQLLLGLAFKLAVARLVGARSFLLLDEPTYGLDRDRRAALLSRLADLGVAEQLLVITHHDVVGVSGHRVCVVRHGKHSVVEQRAEQEASA